MTESNITQGRRSWIKAIVFLALTLGFVGGGIYVYKEYIEDNVFAKRWGVVEEGKIYRSGQVSARLIRPMLEDNEIQVVVDLTKGAPDGKDQLAEREAVEDLGIERLQVPLKGNGTGDVRSYIEALTKLHESVEQGKPVLVHCAAGAQRTGGAIAFYRLLFQNMAPDDVLAEMEEYDWDARKNWILVDYMNEHMDEVARALVDRKMLDEMPEKLPVLGHKEHK